ncbi:hypothetical protein OZX69_01260 [Lactobacillus sp. ESL0731]|uniref:TetR/AcrR family transcriptional regulator n=1 Tax=unclassified Lactobacillus TaxID=2620435 RepID=UPI0023F8D124|nr:MULTISPECIES: hypothetical protein [unclassified Lactobacillus]WEV51382.1 hypothetical protein OZX63_01260 [Lactobacillus sp. ESL0700]WEV62512.1 hypothetical protein OZX69_01260 [Lactobacillus sp. ESL0731]
MTKEDLRVTKTKLVIQNGFAKCINDKPFSKITIRDLTDAMMINKSTFYKYYHDKYDLRDTMVRETLKAFSAYIDVSFLNPQNSNPFTSYQQQLPKALLPLLHHKSWLKTLWSDHLELDVFTMMQETFAAKFKDYILKIKQECTKYDKLQANLFAASAMQIIKWWFYESPDSSAQEIADIISKCLQFGSYVAFTK